MTGKIVVVLKAVIIHQGRILILKRSGSDKVGAGGWETAGGNLEFGEDLDSALIREIKEEAGIHASIDRLLFATTFFTDPGRQIVLLSYLCRTDEPRVTLSHEHDEYRWATKSELVQYLPEAIISDFTKHGVFAILELI